MIALMLRTVKKTRDTVLTCLSAIYGIGYLVWSVNAYNNNLGILPAFEAQYFVSGLVPFAIFIFAFSIIRSSQKWAEKLVNYIISNNYHTRAIYAVLSLYLVLGMLMLCVVKKMDGIDDSDLLKPNGFMLALEWFAIVISFLLAAKICMAIVIHHMKTMEAKSTKGELEKVDMKSIHAKVDMKSIYAMAEQSQSGASWFFATATYVCAFLASLFFSIKIYPQLPQELGGLNPKSVCIVFKNETSKNPAFGQIESQCADSSLPENMEYKAYYKNDDKVILKKGKSDRTLEIRYSEIEYLEWK